MSHPALQRLLKIGANAAKITQSRAQATPTQDVQALFTAPLALFDDVLAPLIEQPAPSAVDDTEGANARGEATARRAAPRRIQRPHNTSQFGSGDAATTPQNPAPGSGDVSTPDLRGNAPAPAEIARRMPPALQADALNRALPQIPQVDTLNRVISRAMDAPDAPRPNSANAVDDAAAFERLAADLRHAERPSARNTALEAAQIAPSTPAELTHDDIAGDAPHTFDDVPTPQTPRRTDVAQEAITPHSNGQLPHDAPPRANGNPLQTPELQRGQRVRFANGGSGLSSILQQNLGHPDAPNAQNTSLSAAPAPQAQVDDATQQAADASQHDLASLLEEIADQLEFDILRTYGTSGMAGE